MARTESFTIQVHPRDEQEQIGLMEKFHWSLLSTQEIKTKDSHLEARGDGIYSVTETEHYIKLAFSRAMDNPNLGVIKKLEAEFFGLKFPTFPKLFPIHWGLWIFTAFMWGIGILGWLAYFFLIYKPKKASADVVLAQTRRRQEEILQTIAQFA